MKLKVIVTLLLLAVFSSGYSQEQFTAQDTLRGSITPEREWWDLSYYHLDIAVKPDQKFIEGKNTIQYKVLSSNSKMQIDLQPPMQISKIVQDGKELSFESNINAHIVTLTAAQKVGETKEITVYYSGHPKEAIRAPWDGGFSWKKDSNGKHFIATSCQGLGASVWWPNKDHMYDEVDSMRISVKVPKDLVNVSNGKLEKITSDATTKTFHYLVKNPINNYGVNVNIGDYVFFNEIYDGEKGPLEMNYAVLRENLEKAKKQFKEAPRMMKAFEHWFGPYPFYEDSFKLVEVPYLGMEHQSSVTYGNKYQNGYLGRDLSESGWGLKFDFIIVHEAGHEWFANNITNIDTADMWIHESFTAYSESLFVDYYFGKKAGAEYVTGTRKLVLNKKPIIGPYNVNGTGGDIYYKGANILHQIRCLVEDDELWRETLRGLNSEFYHKTVTTAQVEDYICKKIGKDLSAYFQQYLRTIKIPNLEYKITNNKLSYRYTNIVTDFDMPIKVALGKKMKWIYPTSIWKEEKVAKDISDLQIEADFYVIPKKI